jgi:sigma-E factor negative regulatory protein RseC
MIQTRAVVIRLVGGDAVVESAQGSSCGHCSAENGCGSARVSQLFCSESRQFRVRNDIDASIGSTVEVVLPEGVLLSSALLMYLLPLLMLLAGAILGMQWTDNPDEADWYSVAGGGLGLLFSYFIIKGLSVWRHLFPNARPVILPVKEQGRDAV